MGGQKKWRGFLCRVAQKAFKERNSSGWSGMGGFREVLGIYF